MGLTMESFIDLCILCGCDYCPKIEGLAKDGAWKLIKQYGCIENILKIPYT